MNLKEAREIARKVGATIEEKTETRFSEHDNEYECKLYVVRLGVCKIGDNGTREEAKFECVSPADAANLAVLETGRCARALVEVAKRVYVESDLIFGVQRT